MRMNGLGVWMWMVMKPQRRTCFFSWLVSSHPSHGKAHALLVLGLRRQLEETGRLNGDVAVLLPIARTNSRHSCTEYRVRSMRVR
jgi:hypothetical protein